MVPTRAVPIPAEAAFSAPSILSLSEVAQISPVNILYIGTDTEFMAEINAVLDRVPDTDAVEFTCFKDAPALIERLFSVALPAGPVVVYGLFRYFERAATPPPAVLRQWTALHTSGVEFVLAEETGVSHPLMGALLTRRA